MERKLAAIFSTDVKGYSRLMGDDEEATIRTIKTYRAVISGLIERYHGRVVDSPGDNLLAEFASAVDAVKSAVAIQQELKTRNAELEDHRKMEFRIGLNVGDVIADEGRLYGDGVNIAARLESLADPGGICLSESVHMQVQNKLAFAYDYIGEQAVKNIAKPVPVYKVQLESHGTAPPAGSSERSAHSRAQATRPVSRWPITVLGVAILVVAAGVLTRRDFSPPPSPRSEPESREEKPALPLPDKPSIVVLPFVNLSGDPEQEYFSDGLTEDLTGALSRLSELFVISRNTAFFYKGQALKMADLSRELGVQYVVEGSVQKARDQVRITAQLIDAPQDHHLWSERYDRPLQNLFALQDEIVQRIVATLKLQLSVREQGVFVRKTTENLEAYDVYLRGLALALRSTQEGIIEARQLFERAIELDPTYAEAYAGLGHSYFQEWVWQWSQDTQSLDRALALTQQAIAMDSSLAMAYQTLSQTSLFRRQYAQAITEGERAIRLDGNDPHGYRWLAQTMNFAGKPQAAIALAEKAIRLDPRNRDWYLLHVGLAYHLTRRYEEARTTFKNVVARDPNHLGAHLLLASTYSELGQAEEARAEITAVLGLSPHFSLEGAQQRLPFKQPQDLEHFLRALRKAGLK